MNGSTYPLAANDPLAPHVREARRLVNWGMAVVIGGLLPVAAWMTFAPLSSAVVAQAYVKVDLNRRPVQHAEGGIVREVLVRDGQRVGRVSPCWCSATCRWLPTRTGWTIASRPSSRAWRGWTPSRPWHRPSSLPASRRDRAADPRLAQQMAKERALFDARRDALVGQVRLLRSQREKVPRKSPHCARRSRRRANR